MPKQKILIRQTSSDFYDHNNVMCESWLTSDPDLDITTAQNIEYLQKLSAANRLSVANLFLVDLETMQVSCVFNFEAPLRQRLEVNKPTKIKTKLASKTMSASNVWTNGASLDDMIAALQANNPIQS